ncbi:hypothetical protein [Nocardia asteroides]|uniref:hypothetical protein n=1 Tax=Nocardia asteroides TaxID=1824 RepID=UPI001E4A942A|nr:hypothetical protein [Nocardia asteroides]UGT60240.1 hypothetical protein LTT61_23995 [Nocardia asteroides]
MILFGTVAALLLALLVVGLWDRCRPAPSGRPTVADIQARLDAEQHRRSRPPTSVATRADAPVAWTACGSVAEQNGAFGSSFVTGSIENEGS